MKRKRNSRLHATTPPIAPPATGGSFWLSDKGVPVILCRDCALLEQARAEKEGWKRLTREEAREALIRAGYGPWAFFCDGCGEPC